MRKHIFYFLGLLQFFTILCIVNAKSSSDPLPGPEDWSKWSNDEVEKQMSPWMWNPNNLTKEEVLEKYEETLVNGTKLAQTTFQGQKHYVLDLPYGEKPAEKIDFYGTEFKSDSLIFFWIHGGYWQGGSKNNSGGLSITLATGKIREAVMGYTLAPEATIEEMQEEVILALKFISEKYPEAKIIVGGYSAGAHLAASILYSDGALKVAPALAKQLVGLLLVSGVYDLRPVVRSSFNQQLHLTNETAKTVSPLLNAVHSSWQSVPLQILIMAGGHDSPEFQRQSISLNEQLATKFNSEFFLSTPDDHFTIVENIGIPNNDAFAKFRKFLLRLKDKTNSAGATNVAIGLVLISTILVSQF